MPHIPHRPKPQPKLEEQEKSMAPIASQLHTDPTSPPEEHDHRKPTRKPMRPGLPVISLQRHNIRPSEVARLLFGHQG